MAKIVSIAREGVGPIENDVPMPVMRVGAKFPVALLKIGQSFTVPRRDIPSVRSSIEALKRRKNGTYADWQFITRAEADRYRVWRIK